MVQRTADSREPWEVPERSKADRRVHSYGQAWLEQVSKPADEHSVACGTKQEECMLAAAGQPPLWGEIRGGMPHYGVTCAIPEEHSQVSGL